MVAALLAAAIAVAFFFRGSEREDVAAYVQQVNGVQADFARRFSSINEAYAKFRVSPGAVPAELPRLRQAARALTDLRARVERIDAPPAAEELRRRMIAFLKMQELVAYELVEVNEYLPKVQAAERPIALANARLAAALNGAETLDEQGRAVGRYANQLNAVARDLDAIEPPSLLAPSHDGYVAQLRRYASSSRALSRAVASGDNDAIAATGAQLREAASAPSGTARAQRRAIGAYNARVARIRTLGLAVERERQRLDRELT